MGIAAPTQTQAQVITNESPLIYTVSSVVYAGVSSLATDSVDATVVAPAPIKPKRETWRQIARRVLKEKGVYSKRNYELLTHCIWRESRGHEKSRSGQYLGCLQFGRSWSGTRAQKLDYEWSMKRWVKVLKVQGRHGIYKHWCRWHRCGRTY